MRWHKFYWEWIRRSFRGSYGLAELITFSIALTAWFVTWAKPALINEMTPYLWQVPFAVFVATFLVALLLAPYGMYRDLESRKDGEINTLSREISRATGTASIGGVQEFLCEIADKARVILDETSGGKLSLGEMRNGIRKNKEVPSDVFLEWHAEMCEGVSRAVRSHIAKEFLRKNRLPSDPVADKARDYLSSCHRELRALTSKLTEHSIAPGFNPDNTWTPEHGV